MQAAEERAVFADAEGKYATRVADIVNRWEKMASELDLAPLLKAREFIYADVAKCISAGANFLVALGLCAYTEFFGRLSSGIPRSSAGKCFRVFFRKLGPCYETLVAQRRDVYGDVRCGLAHEYVTEKGSEINNGTGPCGIEYLSADQVRLNLVTYFDDFKKAVDRYIDDLKSNPELRRKYARAMKGKPVLV